MYQSLLDMVLILCLLILLSNEVDPRLFIDIPTYIEYFLNFYHGKKTYDVFCDRGCYTKEHTGLYTFNS